MPEGPTPPNGRPGTTKWLMQSLTQTPPELVRESTRCCAARSLLNMYSARGLGRALTKRTAASTSGTVMIGRSGPKISSCISGVSAPTSSRIVSSMNFSLASVLPPCTTVPCSIRLESRAKWPSETTRL